MKILLDQIQELINHNLGTIQKIWMGGTELETWFVYTGDSPICINEQVFNNGDMLDLSYWYYDE